MIISSISSCFRYLFKDGSSVNKPVYAQIISSSQINPEFREHYLRYIKPQEAYFEQARQEALKAYRFRIILVVIAILFFTLLLDWAFLYFLPFRYIPEFGFFRRMLHIFSSTGEEESIMEMIMVVYICLCLYVSSFASKPLNSYVSKVKREVFPQVFAYFGKSFSYSEKSRLLLKELQKDSLLIPIYDSAELSDYVKGSISGVNIKLSQANLTLDSVSHKKEVTVFKGVMALFSMNKSFSGKTVIKHDKGGVGNYINYSSPSSYQRVKLEDVKFENQFEVYSTDQVEARYLLTPGVMERFLYLAEIFSAKIEASFFNNHLLILIHTDRDFFEISNIKKPVNFIYDSNLIIEEMKTFLKIIEILKLEKK